MNQKTGFGAFAEKSRPELKKELENVVSLSGDFSSPGLQEMIRYQLGWSGEDAGPKAEGKRIRPLLVFLASEAAGGMWTRALPAAAAVELIHNFSLIHDDIEDKGETRRGRPTVWKLWGEAQAINTGDAMFALANISLQNLANTTSPAVALKASSLFHLTCLRLTQGQHLDIHFEDLDQVSEDEYWKMVSGKTAALLTFCLEVGAVTAMAAPEIQASYRDFGYNLGLAFQVQDDILGIWGDQAAIGKSTSSDLVEGKKTLPVLFGLSQGQMFYQRWKSGPIQAAEAQELSALLESEGALAYAQKRADQFTELALNALERAEPLPEAGKALREMANLLLNRKV